MTGEGPDFKLFSSLRFDTKLLESPANTALSSFPCPFYMLPYHRDRMLQAATHFGWSKAIERISGPSGLQYLLAKLEAVIDVQSSPPLRVRILLDYHGQVTVETDEVAIAPLENLFPSRIPLPEPKMKVSPLTGGAFMLGQGDHVRPGGPGHGDPQLGEPWTVMAEPKKTTPSPFT